MTCFRTRERKTTRTLELPMKELNEGEKPIKRLKLPPFGWMTGVVRSMSSGLRQKKTLGPGRNRPHSRQPGQKSPAQDWRGSTWISSSHVGRCTRWTVVEAFPTTLQRPNLCSHRPEKGSLAHASVWEVEEILSGKIGAVLKGRRTEMGLYT